MTSITPTGLNGSGCCWDWSLVFSLFQWTAATLGSDFGQWGFLIAALVVAATIAVERVLFGQRVLSAAESLGLGVPRMKGLRVAGGVALLLFP